MSLILHRLICPTAAKYSAYCSANLHLTNALHNPRDPRKKWDDFVRRWQHKVDEIEDRVYKERQKQKKTFDDRGGSYDLRGNKALQYFPTTTQFNNTFDKAFSKLPSASDLVNSRDPKYRPYLQLSRVDKPIGSWLLFLPGAWSICIASPVFHLPSLPLLFLFGVGAVAMRGAGCTINDMWDIDIDRKVARTRDRPLASGALDRKQATSWLGIQLGLSAFILLSLNTTTIALGLSSLLLVAIYPVMKRLTDYPQLFLGVTFNYGALMGYTAYTGTLAFTPFALYFAGICWTMVYDTIYAHQDKQDDVLVGVRSTALQFGDKTLERCSVFTSLMGLGLAAAGIVNGMGPIYWVASFFSTVMILRGLSLVNLDDPQSCWEFFVMNRNIGLLILFGIILGKFV